MNKYILFCDDDEGITDIAQLVLEEKGYEVRTLMTSDHIFDEIRKRKPAVILLDLWMPTLGGETITKRLKSDENTKDIPVIIISASTDTKDVSKRAGADDYLSKPFDLIELERIVEKYA